MWVVSRVDSRSVGDRSAAVVAGDFGQGQQDDQDGEIEHQADDRHEGDSLGSLAAGLIARSASASQSVPAISRTTISRPPAHKHPRRYG